MTGKIREKLFPALMAILLVVLSIQYPLNNLLTYYWQDIVTIIIALLLTVGLIVAVISALRRRQFSYMRADIFLILYVTFVLLNSLWSLAPENQFLGLRVAVFAALFYFFGRMIVNEALWLKIAKIAYFVVLSGCALQLLFWLAGAPLLAAEHFAGSYARLQGTLPGPNQLATLLMIFSIYLYWAKQISWRWLAVGLALLGVTYSRSAILGAMFGLILPWIFMSEKALLRKRLPFVTLITITALTAIVTIPELREVFIENRHNSLRLEIYQDTFARFGSSDAWRLLIGHGPGTAGPASFYIENGFVPENWFIQIAYEFGFVGLGLLLLAWGTIFINAVKQKRSEIIAVLIAVFVNSLFLHPLSDNTVAAIWFYILLGLGYTKTINNEKV